MGPNGRRYTQTFETAKDALGWLTSQHAAMSEQRWKAATPRATGVTLRDYTEEWLTKRLVKGKPLADRTKDTYRDLLTKFIYPTFGHQAVHQLDRQSIQKWFDSIAPETPTYRAKSYSLLRSILNTAVAEELLDANPAQVHGGSVTVRQHNVRPASLDELAVIVETIPDRYKAAVLIAAWCAVRHGELVELRRDDVELIYERRTPRSKPRLTRGRLHIRRGAVLVRASDTEFIQLVKSPKSAAGIRVVNIPPHLLPAIEKHLDEHAAPGPGGLLFPSRNDPEKHLRQSSLAKVFYPARKAAGRPDLRWHDLRHTGATLAAQSGATLADLMARLGHSTVKAALIYQHSTAERDEAIADDLSELAAAHQRGKRAKR